MGKRDEPKEETVLYGQPACTLFQWCDGSWKDKGVGEARLLRHERVGQIFFAFVQKSTKVVFAEHRINGDRAHCTLKPNAGSKTCWAWSYVVDGVGKSTNHLALRVNTLAAATNFHKAFEQAKLFNRDAEAAVQDSELYSRRARLYQFTDDQWNESDFGEAKLLRRRAGGKVRFVFWPEGSAETLAEHDVAHSCVLRPNAGSDTCWAWGTPSGRIALQFRDPQAATSFKSSFSHAKELTIQALGFEGESTIYSQRSLLYRFVDHAWQKGIHGVATLLRHGRSGRVRFVFRQCKENGTTTRVIANHYLVEHDSNCNLKQHAQCATRWTWCGQDMAGSDSIRDLRLALEFTEVRLATHFADSFNRAKLMSSHAQELSGEGDGIVDMLTDTLARDITTPPPPSCPVGGLQVTLTRSDFPGYAKKFVLDGQRSVSVGRAPESDVCVSLSGVSSTHAKLVLRDGSSSGANDMPSACLQDMSTNGTILELPDGDIVGLSKGNETPLPTGARIVMPRYAKIGDGTNDVQVLITVLVEQPSAAAPRPGEETREVSETASASPSPVRDELANGKNLFSTPRLEAAHAILAKAHATLAEAAPGSATLTAANGSSANALPPRPRAASSSVHRSSKLASPHPKYPSVIDRYLETEDTLIGGLAAKKENSREISSDSECDSFTTFIGRRSVRKRARDSSVSSPLTRGSSSRSRSRSRDSKLPSGVLGMAPWRRLDDADGVAPFDGLRAKGCPTPVDRYSCSSITFPPKPRYAIKSKSAPPFPCVLEPPRVPKSSART